MEKTNTTAVSKTSTTSTSPYSTLPAVVKTLNSPEGIKHFLATVPSKIEQVLDRPPVSELIRAGAKKESIEACLSVQITKTSNMLTVGGNLREGQALEIAIQLIHDYPNESLEDFCLMLRRGVKGAYVIDGKSDIFRFDALVINNWMKAYLDDKCQAAEDRLMEEKEVHKEQYLWKDVKVSDEKAKEYLKTWYQRVMDSKPEVEPQYQEPPRRGTGYKDEHPPEYFELKDRIRRAASEYYRERHSFSKMALYLVGDHDVFAESQEDAEKIYELANKG